MLNTVNTNVRNGKLPPRTFGVFAIILLLAVSSTWWITRKHYNTSDASDRAFLRLDSSLNNADKFLMNACKEDSLYMEDKVKQPGFEKIVAYWKPKVDSTILVTRKIINFLDELKDGVSLSQSSQTGEPSETKRFTQMELSNNLNKLKAGHALYDSLKNYVTTLFFITAFKREEYLQELPILKIINGYNNADAWNKAYLFDLNLTEASAILTRIKYEVWHSANFMTDLYTSQWCDILQLDNNFNYFLTTQNSSYFLPGQPLEISAGLGAYVVNTKPTIFVNGQEQLVNAEGYTIFKKIITSGEGGRIPITISYTDPNTGKIKTMSKQITYTVIQPSPK